MSGLIDLFGQLKLALGDSNKSVVRDVIEFIGRLVEAIGNTCKKHLLPLVGPLI